MSCGWPSITRPLIVERHLADLASLLGYDEESPLDREVPVIRFNFHHATDHAAFPSKRTRRFGRVDSPWPPQLVDTDTLCVPFPELVKVGENPSKWIVGIVVPGL